MLIAVLIQRKRKIRQDGINGDGKTKYPLDFSGKGCHQLGAQVSYRRNQNDMFGFIRVQKLEVWVQGFRVLGSWVLGFK